jgi:hypothetical protein
MSMMLLFMHDIALLHPMHRIMLLSAHMCSYTLDLVKPKLEELTKQAQAEEATNTELTEGKPRCIPPIFLDFWFSIIIYVTVCLCIKL